MTAAPGGTNDIPPTIGTGRGGSSRCCGYAGPPPGDIPTASDSDCPNASKPCGACGKPKRPVRSPSPPKPCGDFSGGFDAAAGARSDDCGSGGYNDDCAGKGLFSMLRGAVAGAGFGGAGSGFGGAGFGCVSAGCFSGGSAAGARKGGIRCDMSW